MSTTASQSSPSTDISSCSQPVKTCCTALAFSLAQPAFIFDIYPNQSPANYSLPRSSSSFLSSLYTANTRRYSLTVTDHDTITHTVSTSVHSPTSFNVDYQAGTSYPRSLYGSSPLYVTPQPSQICPVYVMPSPDNTQQITEALAEVTQLQRSPQAVPDVFNGEEKDRTRFFLWETAFKPL